MTKLKKMYESLADTNRGPNCSFCDKNSSRVKCIIEGPSVWICDECVLVCADILTKNDSPCENPKVSKEYIGNLKDYTKRLEKQVKALKNEVDEGIKAYNNEAMLKDIYKIHMEAANNLLPCDKKISPLTILESYIRKETKTFLSGRRGTQK